ncbi:MAG: hypothetical protein AVDCRST_MAG76-1955, partial [uncultured Acidimicrobiales bacterium]
WPRSRWSNLAAPWGQAPRRPCRRRLWSRP